MGSDHKMKVRGVAKHVLNLSTFDFLGLGATEDIKQSSLAALDKYGCGSCGPRGFYGTIDQHLNFEAAIAKYMGTEVRGFNRTAFYLFENQASIMLTV
jgi:serine palmitoyltransferase